MRASLDIGQAVAELRRLGPNGEAARELLDLLEAADNSQLRRALRLSRRGMSEDHRARLAQRNELLRTCRREHFTHLDDQAAAREMQARWLHYVTGAGQYDSVEANPYPQTHERATWWQLRQLGWPPLGADRLRHLIRG